MSSTKKIIIVSGPTATGKTDTSIELALYLKSKSVDTVIINFDSLCFYKELEIGTAKPSVEELARHPHRLVNITSAKENFNASHFIELAEKEIEELQSKGIIPILVGGSAFYLRALIKGMYESGKTPDDIKDKVETQYQSAGIAPIREFLKQHDPGTYASLHENDHYRLMRAYEYFLTTGQPFSLEKKKMDLLDPYDFSDNIKKDWLIHHIYLDIPKEEHFEIIKHRTVKMLDTGLIDEVEKLLKSGFVGNEKALGSIGYKEVISYLKGEIPNINTLIEEISVHTRQLAKSQRTFFKKIHPKYCYHPLLDQDKIKRTLLEGFIG